MSAGNATFVARVARDLQLPGRGVGAVLELLEGGATVPFLARYRKEVTGDLDEVQIRDIQERHAYLQELEARRRSILQSIEEQGKLSPELRAAIEAADSKTVLEDLYLPYKKKRRTRATVARERGLEPLAQRMLAQPRDGSPTREAAAFVDEAREVPDAEAALAGARDIVAEIVTERADVRALLRGQMAQHGVLAAKVVKGRDAEPTKFEEYYDYSEPVVRIPSHRYLAIRRGEEEGVLRGGLEVDSERLLGQILRLAGHEPRSPWGEQLELAVQDGYKRLLFGSIETGVRVDLKQRADEEAVEVFARNLSNLLLSAPFGPRAVVGIDPGLRTGCKCAAVEATGRFAATVTINPHAGDRKAAARDLLAFVRRHRPEAIAVGNGTAGRETEAFVREVLDSVELGGDRPFVVLVNESGASIYSASDLAREEFPDLDLTIRGAISIARRLQDPLAELVKIDPKSIGVGQYQHDVHQPLLKRKLDDVIERCVNRVGVDLNTASAALLGYVAGIGPALAKRIVAHREARGPFEGRTQLLDVTGLGPKAFEQCAGFLRVKGGRHPLDASAVHPERYALVERIAADLRVPLAELVGSSALAAGIDVARYVGDDVGELTLGDIVAELAKPGRDPRQAFEAPAFRDDVRTLQDLQPGMVLEGVVTNVTHFGAFVDIGVKQDGLVHISQLADRFVRDPHEVVQVGGRVKVKVLEVDLARKRIGLSCRMDAAPQPSEHGEAKTERPGSRPGARGAPGKPAPSGARSAPPTAVKDSGFANNPFATLKKKP